MRYVLQVVDVNQDLDDGANGELFEEERWFSEQSSDSQPCIFYRPEQQSA